MNILNLARRSTFAACLCAGTALAAPHNDGVVYTGWGLFGGGKNFAAFDLGGGLTDMTADSVVGPDGSLYVAGTVQDQNGLPRIGVAKFGPDGTLDPIFSGDGRNISLEANVHATAVALTADGRLLVSGYKVVSSTEHDFIVCRFSAVSGANLNFPAPVNNSCVKPVWPAGTKDQATGIVVQPDGKFVIGGNIDIDSGGSYAGFARFLANGQPDTAFGNILGSNVTVLRTANIFARHRVHAIALASNGKIVAVGDTVPMGASNDFGLIIRLEADGQPETLMLQPELGIDLVQVNETSMTLREVVTLDDPMDAPSDDDDFVVAGSATINGFQNGFIGKFNHTGINFADDEFGIYPGYTLVPINNTHIRFDSVAHQPGGGFLVGGSRPGTDALDMAVQRFNNHGLPDVTFGDGGGFFIDMGYAGVIDIFASVAVQGDGIYVAGSSLVTGGDYNFTVAKHRLDRIFVDGLEGFD